MLTAPFGTLVFRGISDNPNPTLKRLMISFLTLEGKGLLVPCIRRQRFTRIVKAPKRISCHLELGNLNVHGPIMCKPMYTATHRGENRYTFTGIKLWRLLFIFSAGFRLSHETSSQRISCLVKIRDSFGFSFYCCRFSVYGLFLSALCSRHFFASGLKTIKISRVTYRKIEPKKLTFQFCSESLNYHYDVTK